MRKLQSVSFELNVSRASVIRLALLFTWCHIRASGTANGSSVLLPCMDTCVFTDLTPWWRHMDHVWRLKEEAGFRASTSSQPCKCAGGSLTPAPCISSSVYMLVMLLGAFCALVFLLVALVAYGSRLTFSVLKTRLPKSLVTATNQSDLTSLSIIWWHKQATFDAESHMTLCGISV